jgi:hypothetical protein
MCVLYILHAFMYTVHPEVKKIPESRVGGLGKIPGETASNGKTKYRGKRKIRKIKEMTEIQQHFMCCRILYIGLIRPSNKPSHVVPKCTLFNLDFCAYCVNDTRATTFL